MRKLASQAFLAAILFGAVQAGAQSGTQSGTQPGEVPGTAERGDVRRVITAQIEAFRHDDGAAALGYAAPGIKAKYADPGAFLSMVRAAYPPVFRPRSYSFGAALLHGGLLMQKVEIVGQDGAPSLALYEMEHEADGTWRIAGCLLEKSEQIQL